MKNSIIVVGILALFLISGCIEGFGAWFGPEGTVTSFYNSLDKGSFDVAAQKTDIFIDSNSNDKSQLEGFKNYMKAIFGDGGSRVDLQGVSVVEKTEKDILLYQIRYAGNVSEVYDMRVRIPFKVSVGLGPVEGSVEATVYVNHDVIKVDNKWYIANWRIKLTS